MTKILITGANSYIGMQVANYLCRWPERYTVDTVDMIDGTWRSCDFSAYDVIYHVAGIAHSDGGKISPEQEKLYRSVNTDLAVETAEKARSQGVKQFIFMSSAIVYGDSASLGRTKLITKDTLARPANCYGDSKLQAEIGLHKLESDSFKIVILRPPMIYGKGSKGNYPVLAKLARKVPLFPKVNNCRSMLYVENLCEFVKLMIDNREQGTFWPQNAEYTNTSEMVRAIAASHGKKIRLTKLFNWGLYLLRPFTGLVDKAFGSLAYDCQMSAYPKGEYCLVSLEESIERTEN